LTYVALTFWLFLILFAGIGVYRMLGSFGNSRWVDWALLPGTLVSEMAYILGCLITGGEVRRARLVPSGKGGSSAAPGAEAAPRLKVIGPILAALVAIVVCMAAIVVLHALLGEPILTPFSAPSLVPLASQSALPKSVPTSWDGLWEALHGQLGLVRRMAETWGRADWLDWRVPLFVYLALCLSIRLAPVSRPVRPTLAAAVAIAVAIALAGLVSTWFDGLIGKVWPLLTYIWTSLLLLLLLTLLVRGIIRLAAVLTGKGPRQPASRAE